MNLLDTGCVQFGPTNQLIQYNTIQYNTILLFILKGNFTGQQHAPTLIIKQITQMFKWRKMHTQNNTDDT